MTLKNKNMKKKIENATKYIEEIDNHKKSIFEFWKYSNKDEVSTLTKGEEEEIGIEHKIVRPFNYKEDKEKLGVKWDKWQRAELTKEELEKKQFLQKQHDFHTQDAIERSKITQTLETELEKLKLEQDPKEDLRSSNKKRPREDENSDVNM